MFLSFLLRRTALKLVRGADVFGLILEVCAMRISKRTWMVGLTGAALITVIAAIPSLVVNGLAMMMHGGHDQAEAEDHGGYYLTHLLKHAKEIGLQSGTGEQT
jgi:hypothetical protein